MSRAAWSMLIFGIYVSLFGVALTFAPQFVVSLFKLPAAPVGWVRTAGLLALVIGAYDTASAWIDSPIYYRTSIFSRIAFAIAVGALVITEQMPPSVLPLGVIDVIGATWTALAMRSQRTAIVAA